MATGTRTFGLDETLIEPRVLEPPPTRHALLIFVVVLAGILHLGTAGWSEIHNGPEGYYASASRDMFRANSWTPPVNEGAVAPNPPLAYWTIVASYKLLGVTPTAARMPFAVAMVLCVALTFLIGERLANYWRGFVAALIQLCWLGSFVWGRMATAEPLFSACICGAMLCAISGYQRAQGRRLWFAGVWGCVALACLTKGAVGLLYPGLVLLVLAVCFREARLRFRQLLDWRYLLAFVVVMVPLYLWSRWDWLPTFGHDSIVADTGQELPVFLLRNAVWWFPAFLLVVPGALFAMRKILRPHEFDFATALPLCWIAVGLLPLAFYPARQDYQTMSMWSALALWIACAWDRTGRGLRLAGLGLVPGVGVVLAGARLFGAADWMLPSGLPAAALGALPSVIGLGLIAASAVAAYLAWQHREEFAIATILLTMVPIGLSVAEATARFGSHFSMSEAAKFLGPRLGETGEVLFEGEHDDASSLRFYLNRHPIVIDPNTPGSPDACSCGDGGRTSGFPYCAPRSRPVLARAPHRAFPYLPSGDDLWRARGAE
jgi:4-amino-4-deoxy-L-arabinose transferase